MMRKTWKQLFWDWRGVWITTPSVALLVILIRLTGVLQPWEWAVFDQYMRLRPPEPPDQRIAIVGLNESDVRELKQAIIPDEIYAELIQKLQAQNPRAIGLDIYRDQPVEPGHQKLVKVFQTTPNLVGIQKVVGSQDRIPPPPSLKLAGANDLIFDQDKTIRRSFLTLPDAQGNPIPSFPLYLAALYLESYQISPQGVPGTPNWWQIGQTVFVPFQANDGAYVRADAGGYQVLLNYRGPRGTFETVSLMDVLKDRVRKDWARDRIILIGAVSESFQDLFFTPYTLSPGDRLAGVEIHANTISQILSAALENRPLIKTWAEPYELLWILFWSAVGSILTWKWRSVGGMRSFSLRRYLGGIASVGVLVGSTFIAFLAGWWLPVVPPALALAGCAIAITGYIARTAGDIRKTFGRYLSDEIVATLLENPEGLKLGGQRQRITILTSDLRGFTTLSEQLSPEEVVKILNFYLSYMADIITSHSGTIDEFMGDGILVLFGAPTQRVDDAERAVACAVAMQQAMIPINQQIEAWNLPPLEMGIGINTGVVVVGNIGSEKRTKYGVVGSQINLTYRIESYTTGGQILISESTLQEAGETVKIESEKKVQPKGVKEPITIYEVGGVAGKYNRFLEKEEETYFALPHPIPLQYTVIEGKQVGETLYRGILVKISAKGGVVNCETLEKDLVPPPLANLKINFFLYSNSIASNEDVYAKVLDNSSEPGLFYIRFTSKATGITDQLLLSVKDVPKN